MDVFSFQKEVLATGVRALGRFTRSDGAVSEPAVQSEGELSFQVLGHWLGSILVATRILKVTLKVHYSLPSVMEDWMDPWRSQLQSEGRAFVVREFGKEFTNWWAGDLKKALDPEGNESSMGLPMICRGFDEIYSRRSNARDCHFSAARIVGQKESSLWVSSLLELKSPKDFSDWNWEPREVISGSEKSGEVEFL